MLELERVSAEVAGLVVIRGVTVQVPERRIIGILGPNGAGKTTLLKTISGLARCTAGAIRWGGTRIENLAPARIVRLGLAHVPQNRELFADLTVRENLELGALGPGRAGELRPNLERVYQYFPVLAERARQSAGTLSGGEQQMLAIGRALMARPRLLMLDEPSSGLAPRIVRGLAELIKRLRDEGLTVLLVEQNVALARDVVDYLYVLGNGAIIDERENTGDQTRESLAQLYLGAASGWRAAATRPGGRHA
jgi:branched-chain amino acid transport system ATP-binding protein